MSRRTLLFVLAGIVWAFPVMGQQNQDKVKRLSFRAHGFLKPVTDDGLRRL